MNQYIYIYIDISSASSLCLWYLFLGIVGVANLEAYGGLSFRSVFFVRRFWDYGTIAWCHSAPVLLLRLLARRCSSQTPLPPGIPGKKWLTYTGRCQRGGCGWLLSYDLVSELVLTDRHGALSFVEFEGESLGAVSSWQLCGGGTANRKRLWSSSAASQCVWLLPGGFLKWCVWRCWSAL